MLTNYETLSGIEIKLSIIFRKDKFQFNFMDIKFYVHERMTLEIIIPLFVILKQIGWRLLLQILYKFTLINLIIELFLSIELLKSKSTNHYIITVVIIDNFIISFLFFF